jgi:hypothetical protein
VLVSGFNTEAGPTEAEQPIDITPMRPQQFVASLGGGRMWDETSALAPTLLVAMPQLLDPNFGKTVVLLCEHREEGAMGLVINRCTETTASSIVQLEPPIDRDNGMPVWIGGPVDPSRGWLLVNSDVGDGVEVSPGVFLSASRDLLRRVLESDDLAERSRFLVGLCRLGPAPARRRARRIRLAHRARRSTTDVRDPQRIDVGGRHPQARHRAALARARDRGCTRRRDQS